MEISRNVWVTFDEAYAGDLFIEKVVGNIHVMLIKPGCPMDKDSGRAVVEFWQWR